LAWRRAERARALTTAGAGAVDRVDGGLSELAVRVGGVERWERLAEDESLDHVAAHPWLVGREDVACDGKPARRFHVRVLRTLDPPRPTAKQGMWRCWWSATVVLVLVLVLAFCSWHCSAGGAGAGAAAGGWSQAN